VFAIIFVAASLLTQAYLFRDTPSHPADPCAVEVSLCPEMMVDSLMADRKRNLEQLRINASGKAIHGEKS
jgi:hypothetical protein